jgi:hypothetical protein
MRALSSIASFVVASVCVSGCSLDAGGTGSEAPRATTDQAMTGGRNETTKRQNGDFFRVDLTANSAGGTCQVNTDSGGRCNLRAALAAAPRAQSPVTIELAIDSTIDFEEIVLEAPTTDSGYEVTIRSADAANPQNIIGFGSSRLFQVPAGVTLDMHDVYITGFAATGEGGAIVNHGTVHLHKVTLFDNRATCDGTGALQSEASCAGGAVANYGDLLVGSGTRFESNKVLATAMIAASPTSTAAGGAIVSYGNLVIDGAAVFALNYVTANAWPGEHPVTGVVTTNALGGAVYNAGGTMLVTGSNQSCNFFANQAWALATDLGGAAAVTNSRGGAIASVGGMLQVATGACEFKANGADQDSDIYYAP